MRQSSHSIMSLLFVTTVSTFCSCETFQPGTEETSILIDKTDTTSILPDAHEIISRNDVNEHKWDEQKFSVQVISSLDYNPAYTLTLKGRQPLLSNPDKRDKELQQFEDKFTQAIDSVNQATTGLPKSNIYGVMIRDVNRLAASKATVKKQFIYSNLGQNMPSFSVYKVQNKKLLKERPDSVKKILLKMERPQNLSGITVYLIHAARDDADNEVFSLMSSIIKQILEGAGAKVYIGANEAGAVN